MKKSKRKDNDEEDEKNEEDEENDKELIKKGPSKKKKVKSNSSNKLEYLITKDCKNNCTNKGLCLNSTCYCNEGYTEYDCSLTYKNFKKKGFKLKTYYKYLIAVFFSGFLIMIIYLCLRSKLSQEDYIKLE